MAGTAATTTTTKTLSFSSLILLHHRSPPPSSPPSLPLHRQPFTSSLTAAHSRRHHFRPPSPSPTHLLICRAAAEYTFPDPIPEFAEAEADMFRNHLVERLSKKKDIFGDSVEQVAGVCTEILSTFLHTEYGGPGTLLVVPFIDMADALNERGLPGAPQAARAAVVWAQKHIDDDWDEWTGAAA